MKESFPATTVLCAALILAFSGCSKKTDAKSELEKTASLLEKTEAAPAPATQPLQPAAAPTAEPPPARQMNQALAAYKSGDLQDAVTRLQTLRAMP
ncbi:MAG: hypothetical protein JWR69_815, partial [Pedosphaera sp.]|nr:hypothetical protein [Pedosphaera sp.]